MIHGEDGFVMSKSRGNVIDPLTVAGKYSADCLRLFLVSVASPDKDFPWNSNGIEGSWKFLNKVFEFASKKEFKDSSKKVEHKLNSAIKKITKDVEEVQYNLAVIKLRELFNYFDEGVSKEDFSKFLKMLSLFCPHLSEELWERLGYKEFISLSDWPKEDEGKINEKFDLAEKAADKAVSDIINVVRIVKDKIKEEPKKVYLYVLPNEIENYDAQQLSRRAGIIVTVHAVNDKDKYDPESKSEKAKPGKPGIYVE
jgi:leucyl-tRNA synthetase